MNQKKQHFYLKTPKILLCPYLKQFIPLYHQFMQDEEILYLTGSEPLTIDEELQNQESWLKDESKYTFIIFQKDENIKLHYDDFPEETYNYRMVGDINLFFHSYIEENEAEIDVMIADKQARRQGLAQQAVEIMMDFGMAYYKKNRFIAKIKNDNQKSIKLFEKIGFLKFEEVQKFNEVHYQMIFSDIMTMDQFYQKYQHISNVQI
ncbi:n-acetyltransferase 9, putative [Ichthyophthirius multifiliis]|uniref:N-acetyltransferase 9, putative n=1 Tax=Ichthyophthirius multifiliis TaxID=5932 RepID=G0R050_ICHMU|nr:n-acetyltransferase 9, putative [Ichthyophthirius multifiliis]EGR29149.1 n-acetyltransferase 9, putative [Ichthyophthirius multifiliis]|eukprot:XP_004030385.1 n-acetyltransferase 9, putative [Ichthyophthirius multifiliis]